MFRRSTRSSTWPTRTSWRRRKRREDTGIHTNVLYHDLLYIAYSPSLGSSTPDLYRPPSYICSAPSNHRMLTCSTCVAGDPTHPRLCCPLIDCTPECVSTSPPRRVPRVFPLSTMCGRGRVNAVCGWAGMVCRSHPSLHPRAAPPLSDCACVRRVCEGEEEGKEPPPRQRCSGHPRISVTYYHRPLIRYTIIAPSVSSNE